jgi:glycosyltransferase involved in cell wall biosynthesis
VTRLRIGVDARELLGDTTGVGRYLGELMRRWTARADADMRRLILYVPEALQLSFPGTDVRMLDGGRGTWWEQTTLSTAVRRDDPDIFFAPAYTAPLRLTAPLVVTIHDVSFSRHPEWFSFREGMRRQWLTRSAARRADTVLTVSHFSAREIQELYGVPPGRITVVPNGLTSHEAAAPAPREPLVLYTGSIFNRRRLPDLIAAFARVVQTVPGARLVIVGRDRTSPRQDLRAIAASHGIEPSVQVRAYVPDEELARLYARASAFGFLSEYEGFGLTPLEALAAGVPIVVLDTPVAREVYGDAAEFVAPGDVRATAEALTRLLASAEARAAQLARAPAVLERYSWDAAAEQTLAVLEKAARR